MSAQLNVYALPKLAAPKELADGTVVVLDVLRATTTIIHALEAGARDVYPCETIEETQAMAHQFDRRDCVLGGERGGVRIEGFDLANSPEEYTPELLSGKTVLFTTTNGTQAMARCRHASTVLLGAFVNVSAVVDRLVGQPRIHLVCSGTDGQMTEEDILVAGMIVNRLEQKGGIIYDQNAQAITACETWKAAFPLPISLGAEPLPEKRLAEKLETCLGGRNLVELGLRADILAASRIDEFSSVAELDPESMRITLARS